MKPRIPRRRVSGVLLLDKPPGITSNTALQHAKRLFRAEKAGHTGILDPMATGLLPILFGEATKLSQFLLDSDKTYDAVVRLGMTTDTADAEGEITSTAEVNVSRAAADAALARFRGEIEQVPPMHSAIKRDGRPLYDYARRGIEIERAPRHVRIHALDLIDFDGGSLSLRVHCSKGTYVRVLAEDVGRALGCGAHLAALRRTATGPFALAGAMGFEALEKLDEAGRDALLLPADVVVGHLASVTLDTESAWAAAHGQPFWRPRQQVGDWLRLYGSDGAFLGIAEVDHDGRIAPRRLLLQEDSGPARTP